MRIAHLIFTGLIASALPAHAADAPLSLAETLRLAVAESPNLAAQRALAESATISIGPAGALPDPKMRIAQENWPTNTEERWTRYEVMAMLRVGFSQEFPGGEKLALRTQRAKENAEQRRTLIDVQRAVVQREAAIAWVTRYFAQQAEARVVDQIAEARLAVETGNAQYRAGRTTQAELVALQSAVVDLENRRSEIALDVTRANIVLTRFIGPEANRPLGDPPDLSRLPSAVAPGVLAVDELPEVRAALSREAVVAADANLVREDYWPDWKVDVSYDWRGNQPFLVIPGLPPSGGQPYPQGVSLEFVVDLPISTRTRQGPRLDAKLRELDGTRALREEAKRQQVAEVQAMIAEWETAHEQAMRTRDELIPLVVQKREAALGAYRGGTGTLASVLEARRNDLDARLSLVQQELAAARAWAWLEYVFPVVGQ
jgi:outer membrane protein TolC